MMATAMHDNSGDPSFTMFFDHASEGLQSGINDPKVDDLIFRASAATGEERAKLWSELQAYLHDDVVADVLLFHSVHLARVAPRLGSGRTCRPPRRCLWVRSASNRP